MTKVNDKYYVPVEIDGKWWVVENAPDRPIKSAFSSSYSYGSAWTTYRGILAACTKYPTLESDSAYWASKAGVKMGEGEFEVKRRFATMDRRYEELIAIPINSTTIKEAFEGLGRFFTNTELGDFGEIVTSQHPTTKEQDAVIKDMIVTAAVGTQKQHDVIQAHMDEYFKRWPSYKDRLNSLEWYHLFLDFYDKITALSLPKQDNGDAWDEAIKAFEDETPDYKNLRPDIYMQHLFAYIRSNYSISKIK